MVKISGINNKPAGNFLVALIILFAGFADNLFAQPTPPSLRCISVLSNGNVTLDWVEPLDTGNVFGGYHIFTSNFASGPFTPVDSIFTYSTLTTTITSVNANNTTLFFYIETRDGCCIYSVPSDTLRSMRMIVTPLSNEHVRLNWNRIHNPPLPTTISSYVVSKELTTGVFTNFRTVLDTTTLDTNYFCNKFINYKVTQGDMAGCQSVSSIDGELFRDTKGPAQPLIDTVSVNPVTGDVEISWFPDSSADTQGYVIYEFNGVSYDSIGSVLGINSISFINSLNDASVLSETYSVAAFDSCKNLSPLAVNHKTIFLTTSFIKCDADVTLEWTPYENMNDGLARYEIWLRENAGPWTLEAFVPGTVLSYVKHLTIPGAQYDFLIRAVSFSSNTSSSNVENMTADIYLQPQYLYIRSASVSGSAVKVHCYVDPTGDIRSYVLYGSNSAFGPFNAITTVNYSGLSDITLIDQFSNADKYKRYYKISAVDSCNKEFVESNIAGTVFLMAEGGDDYVSELNWIPYTGWENPPGSYHIYKVVNGITASSPLGSVSGDTLFYLDDVSDFSGNDGNICYVILAREDSVNSFGFSDSAFSNIDCAPQAPSVFIPNAFTPGGKNPIFKPYFLFDDPTTYSLKVFNRWGQNVFESSIPALGWDGTYNEIDSPTGMYAYILVFKGLNKKEIRRTGTVALLR